jgi:hypothetical protein
MAPFKNATSREFRIPPPVEAGGFQFAGIDITMDLPRAHGAQRCKRCELPVTTQEQTGLMPQAGLLLLFRAIETPGAPDRFSCPSS